MLDRGYQAHHLFDQWPQDGCHFVCRTKEATHKEIIEQFPVKENSHVFFNAMVLPGTPDVNQTQKPIHLVGKSYWIATDRFDLLAEQVVLVYKLRWDIEIFSHGGNGNSMYITFLLEVRMA